MEHINNNGYGYVDLGLPSGTLWSTCNVGATKPNEPGLCFQWGSIKGNEEIIDEPESKWKYYDSIKQIYTKYTIPNSSLCLKDDAANMLMQGDWHIPSTNQIQELFDNTIAKWTSMENVLGVIFISKKDKSKSIFMPLYNNKHVLYLWSSETNSKCENLANILHINPIALNINVMGFPRSCQFPIRGVIDNISKTSYKCNYDQRHIWKLELDLVGILKNVPKGTKLWSSVIGDCIFIGMVDETKKFDKEYPIKCAPFPLNGYDYWTFGSNGKFTKYSSAECVLFPSKYNRNWATFKISKV